MRSPAPFHSALLSSVAREQSCSWHNRSDNSNSITMQRMQPFRHWLTVGPFLQVQNSNGGNFYGPLLQLDDIENSAGTSATSANSKAEQAYEN